MSACRSGDVVACGVGKQGWRRQQWDSEMVGKCSGAVGWSGVSKVFAFSTENWKRDPAEAIAGHIHVIRCKIHERTHVGCLLCFSVCQYVSVLLLTVVSVF